MFTYGKTDGRIMVNGKTIKCMAVVNIHGPVGLVMKVNMKMINNQAKVFTLA